MSDLDGSWLSPLELNGALERTGSSYRVPVAQNLGGGAWQPNQPLVQGQPLQVGPSSAQAMPLQAAPAAQQAAGGGAGAAGGASAFGQYAPMAMSLLNRGGGGQQQQPIAQVPGGNPYAGVMQEKAEDEAKRHGAIGKIASIVGAFFTGGASMAGMTAAGSLGNK